MGTSSSNAETEVMRVKKSDGNLASRRLRDYKQLKEKNMSESQLAFKRLRASRPVSFYQSDESPVMLQDFSKPGVLEALEESISKRNVGRSYENWLPQQSCNYKQLKEKNMSESQLAFKRLRASRPVSFYQSDESPVMLQDFSKPGVLEALEESISKRNVGRSYENWLPQQSIKVPCTRNVDDDTCIDVGQDQDNQSDLIRSTEVPENAIVGKAADLRCKLCIFCQKHGEHWTEQCPRRYQ